MAADRAELEALNTAFRPALLRYFTRRIQNHAEAEDLTQDVFISLAKTDLGTIEKREAFLFEVASANSAAFPLQDEASLARFPPTLIISATRDISLSSAVVTHRRLVATQPASLHVWDGVGHAFFYDPKLPQSNEVYQIARDFFLTYLSLSRASPAT